MIHIQRIAILASLLAATTRCDGSLNDARNVKNVLQDRLVVYRTTTTNQHDRDLPLTTLHQGRTLEGHDHDDEEQQSSEVHNNDKKPWGEVIVAALLINLASLIGLVAIVTSFACSKMKKGQQRAGAAAIVSRYSLIHNIIPSFACGALLATAVFLIIPESIAMLTEYQSNAGGEEERNDQDGHTHRFLLENEEGHKDELDEHEDDVDIPVAWRFGASVLGGFLVPIIFSMLFPHEGYQGLEECGICTGVPTSTAADAPANDEAMPIKSLDNSGKSQISDRGDACEETECKQGAKDDAVPITKVETLAAQNSTAQAKDPQEEKEALVKKTTINWSLASTILIGDFLHNFTDGVLVGTAFTLCTRDLAITIAAATIYHELAQELADFFLLTKHCGLSTVRALCLNFLGGLSVLVGAILVLSMDVSSNATGCILAIGAGVYLYIAAGECLPTARSAHKSHQDKLISIASFIGGAVPIGLVLLNHQECEVGDEGH